MLIRGLTFEATDRDPSSRARQLRFPFRGAEALCLANQTWAARAYQKEGTESTHNLATNENFSVKLLHERRKLDQRLADLQHRNDPRFSCITRHHDMHAPLSGTLYIGEPSFERFEALPPEIKLKIMKFTTLCEDQKDLKALILGSRDAHDLWKTSSSAILRFAASCLPEHEEFMLYFSPSREFHANIDYDGNKVLVPVRRQRNFVKSILLRNATRHFEGHGQRSISSRITASYSFAAWNDRVRDEKYKPRGFPYFKMLEAFTRAVDKALKCLKAIPDSSVFLDIDDILLRRALLLLIMMGVPAAPVDFNYCRGYTFIPAMWTRKQTVLVQIQHSDVRKAARKILIFLTYTVRQRLDVFEDVENVFDQLFDEGEIPLHGSEEQFTAAVEALEDWMNDQMRSLVAIWVVENGIGGLFSSRAGGPSPIDERREGFRDAIEWNLLTASRMLLRGMPPDSYMGSGLGRIEPWEELGLCEGTRLWNGCQALIRAI